MTETSPPRSQTPLPIALEAVHALGRLVVEWARLEGSVQRILWHLADLPSSHGQCITMYSDNDKRLFAVRALVKERFPSDPKSTQLNDLCLYIADVLAPIRNQIVHNHTSSGEDEDEVFTLSVSARGSLKDTSIRYPVSYLEQVTRQVLLAGDEIRQLMFHFGRQMEFASPGDHAKYEPVVPTLKQRYP
jgi:hypothetical protein